MKTIRFNTFETNSSNTHSLIIMTPEQMEKYETLFNELIKQYNSKYAIFENEKTLGFVKYVLIPTEKPIIINWNIGSTVSEQICENKLNKINTFKCLVDGNISLSWNKTNIINI